MPVDVAHKLKKEQESYGEKLLNGRIIYDKREEQAHKRELEYIEKMRVLRCQGFSYHKFAAIFNSMGIPTKNKKGRHATTIMKILKR